MSIKNTFFNYFSFVTSGCEWPLLLHSLEILSNSKEVLNFYRTIIFVLQHFLRFGKNSFDVCLQIQRLQFISSVACSFCFAKHSITCYNLKNLNVALPTCKVYHNIWSKLYHFSKNGLINMEYICKICTKISLKNSGFALRLP